MSHPFDSAYFNGGGRVGGYAREGYWDYPVHWTTVRKVMEQKPESVLEIGAARGYVLRRLEDQGVRVKGLEISEHCRATRAVEDIVTWDVTETPWPVGDKEFDLCLSIAFLEHVPEEKLPRVFSEMKRTCKRGLHGVDLHDDDHFDQTHVCIRPAEWWRKRLPKNHLAVDKEDLEKGEIVVPGGAGVKLNLGSFITMFHFGWRNFDAIDLRQFARAHQYDFVHHDVRAGLPFDDGVVDLIFSCHMLEHLSYDEGAQLLRECSRVLKPGGVIRILVPNAGQLVHMGFCTAAPGSLQDFHEISPSAARRPTQMGKLWELLCENHRSAYDFETLEHALTLGPGLIDVHRCAFRQSRSEVMRRETTDLYPDMSLIVEAEKP